MLRKKKIENSVKDIARSDQTQERVLNQARQRKIHFLVNKTKNCHKIIKLSLKIVKQENDSEHLNE